MQLPETVDEATVLKHLFDGTATAQRLQRQVNEITPYFSEFQKWKAEQAKAEQAKQQAGSDKPWYSQWWNPPEFDPTWKTKITKDLDGNLVPAQGAPHDIVQKYLAYEDHRAKVADQFMTNPFEFIKDAVEHLSEQKARAVYESMQQQTSEQQFIQQTVRSPEMSWIYEQDDKGQPRRGVDGQPLLSQWGNVYRTHVQEAYEKGWSVEDQHKWGLAQTQAAFYVAQTQNAQQAAGGTPREKANERLHLRHEHAPNVGGVVPGPAANVAPQPNAPGMDLRDQMMAVLQHETDESLNDFRFGRRSA